MLSRSGRVGTIYTIYTSAAEVRDRSRPAHGAFYSTISLPGVVYNTWVGKGLSSNNNSVRVRKSTISERELHVPTARTDDGHTKHTCR